MINRGRVSSFFKSFDRITKILTVITGIMRMIMRMIMGASQPASLSLGRGETRALNL